MADLYGLPDELLLVVANCLRGDAKTFQTGYSHLKHLALSCRKLQPIAQEVLHLEVAVVCSQKVQGPTRVACLARTLLQRPDLATKVRELHIGISSLRNEHSNSCAHWVPSYEQSCTCGLSKLLYCCVNFLRTAKAGDGLPLHNEKWALMLEGGQNAALARLILCITSALRTLTLTYGDTSLFPRLGVEPLEDGEYVRFDEFIGSPSSHSIGGLSSLTRLVTRGFSPTHLLRSPQLQAARLSQLDDHRYEEDLANLTRSQMKPDEVVSTTLTRLFIQTDPRAVCSDPATPVHGMHMYLTNMIRGLTNLTHLFILFNDPFDDGYDFNDLPQISYAHITSRLENRSLTHLTLEFEDMGYQLAYETMAESVLEYIHDMGPMTTFPGLPNLRNITAPQEAFFSADEDFETCNLPAAIESIGVVDSTYETKRYIKYVLDNRARWPNLKLVELGEGTYDHLYERPDGSDDEDTSESGDEEWRQLFEVDDSIYGQAKSCGVRVEKVHDRTVWKKGWDDLNL